MFCLSDFCHPAPDTLAGQSSRTFRVSGPWILYKAWNSYLPVLTFPSGHKEMLRLDAILSPLFPVNLGVLWLQAHNSSIDWVSVKVDFQSSHCHKHCLPELPVESSPFLCMDSDAELHQVIPVAYHDLLDVFSKRAADTFLPYRPYDCPIELLPRQKSHLGEICPCLNANWKH